MRSAEHTSQPQKMIEYEITIGEFKYLIIGARSIPAALEAVRANGVTLDDTHSIQQRKPGQGMVQYDGIFYA